MPQVASILTRALQSESLSADTDRLINDILLAAGVVGVLEDAYEVVQDTGSNMQIKVGSGAAGDKAVISRDGRVYIIEHQNASQTLTVAASDANDDRIDLVVARIYDDEADSSGNTYADVEVIQGTPAGSPTAPAVPDGAIALAEILVPEDSTAVTNGNITDRRSEVTLRNGAPSQTVVTDDQDVTATSTFAAGSTVCGLAFVAPPSGKVWVDWYGFLQITLSSAVLRRIELGFELREGSSIGSGSVVVAATTVERTVALATALNASQCQASNGATYLVSGLTPGAAYNVRTMGRVNNTANVTEANILQRQISVDPVF